MMKPHIDSNAGTQAGILPIRYKMAISGGKNRQDKETSVLSISKLDK